VGFLRRGNTMTAFIVQGQYVYTLPVGETLDGRYRVQAITEDTLVLSSVSGDKQVRLSLTQEGAPPPAR
jgi:Tfp pilus assembly protein PilP